MAMFVIGVAGFHGSSQFVVSQYNFGLALDYGAWRNFLIALRDGLQA